MISHHLLLCATPAKALCCPDPALGAASWDTLKRLVREWGLEDPDRPEGIVLRTKADCLRICAEGPVLLIWPERPPPELELPAGEPVDAAESTAGPP